MKSCKGHSEVLITGATGFVGKNLLPYLSASNLDYKLHVLGRHDYKKFVKSGLNKFTDSYQVIDHLSGDKKSRHYVHLAGKAHDIKNSSFEEEYFEANYRLTKRLFDHFLENNTAETFTFISSIKAVSDRPNRIVDEFLETNPVTAYGRSKRKAEEYILKNSPLGKRVYILRPCMIHGPGNRGNLNLLYAMISKGIPWPLGAFNNSRSFLSINNFCFIIDRILAGRLKPGIYHLADSKPLSTRRLIELIGESVGKKPRIWNLPITAIYFCAKLGNVLNLPLNEERLQKLTENYVVSNQKLTRALGCDLPVEAEDGMRSTLASFSQS